MKNLEPEKRIVGSTSQQQEIIDDLYNKHYEMLFNNNKEESFDSYNI